MRDTNSVAAITEGRVLAALAARGYTVAIPFGVARYDLIVDMPDGLKRIQCKTGRLKRGAIKFNVFSVNKLGDGSYSTTAYQGDADLFGVYCPDTDKVYLVPVDGHTQTISLRVEPTKSGQIEGTRQAEDFEVD